MSIFVDRIINDDFVWDAICSNLQGRRKQYANHFISVNCPLCVSRGETADHRQRLGIKHNPTGVGFNCFNCGARGVWERGELLSKPMQELLLGIGISEIDVKRLNHKAMSYRSILTSSPDTMALIPSLLVTPQYEANPLPPGTKRIEEWADAGCTDEDFIDSVDYLFTRGNDIASAHPYCWSPDHKFRRRIIIPFQHDGRNVGFTARAIDKTSARYMMEAPTDFLFNYRALSVRDRKFVILAEGVFDAIAVDGVGLMGARLNNQQIAWIKNCGKTAILLPDRDTRGESLIDVALSNNFHVAFPAMRSGHGRDVWWEPDVKDAAEACKRYGRLYTLQSILATATNNKIKIKQLRKNLY